ncbi:MAG: hypothetical protein VB078_02665 [Clostridiaceae bacterium]|nr:hypothetical protein [Clostridiaceae bacterium]
MLKRLATVVLAALALVSLFVFTGKALASEEMKSSFDDQVVISDHNG